MTRILIAGDRFIRSATFRESLIRIVGDRVDLREIEFTWPDEPFGAVAEVDEASGTEDQLIEALDGITAIVTQLAPMTKRVMDASPDLRLIAVSRGGPTNVNLEAARASGIQVANVPGRNGVATAEMTIGLALYCRYFDGFHLPMPAFCVTNGGETSIVMMRSAGKCVDPLLGYLEQAQSVPVSRGQLKPWGHRSSCSTLTWIRPHLTVLSSSSAPLRKSSNGAISFQFMHGLLRRASAWSMQNASL